MYITKPIKSHIYSRPLDIHLTTNHLDIKELLDVLYNKYFNTRKKEITKKHLQVLLLDLYVAWSTDPRLEIGVDMSPNSYNSVKRYNQLNITSTLTDVVTDSLNVPPRTPCDCTFIPKYPRIASCILSRSLSAMRKTRTL